MDCLKTNALTLDLCQSLSKTSDIRYIITKQALQETGIFPLLISWADLFNEFPDHNFEFQVLSVDEWQNKINEIVT